jgi:hypothetical protein
MPATNSRIRVVRGDLQQEAEGGKKYVSDMLARFLPTEHSGEREKPGRTRGRLTGSSLSASLPSAAKAVSAGDIIRQLGFKKHTYIGPAFDGLNGSVMAGTVRRKSMVMSCAAERTGDGRRSNRPVDITRN